MIKKLTSIFLTLALSLCTVLSVHAASSDQLNIKAESTADYLLTCPVPNVASIGGEWMVIGLARSGKITREFSDGYYNNALSYVKSVGSAKLHRSKSTENSRMIIALTAIGKNSQNVSGYDLLAPLADFNFVKKQGINGPVWALIAFDTLRYEIPVDPSVSVQTTREKLIDYILSNQCADGGWDLDGEYFDPDVTGMAVQALAPYVNKHSEVKSAVDKALEAMSKNQNADGSFSTAGENTPESCAQMITALSALNIDCLSDNRFIKNSNSVADSLLGFSVENGFEHTKGMGYNQMSTEQSYYSLVSYQRYISGQNTLYDMTDLISRGDVNFSGSATITDATLIQKYIAQSTAFTLLQQKVADFDKNGRVDINDVTALQKYLVTK